MAIDCVLATRRGQRELNSGDRGAGQTTIAIDTTPNEAESNEGGPAGGEP